MRFHEIYGSRVLCNVQVIIELLSGLILCLRAGLTLPGIFFSILRNSDENGVVSLTLVERHSPSSFHTGLV